MYELGIDIGGTFTDLILIDKADGRCWLEKVLTTPDAPWDGVAEGMRRILDAGKAQGCDLGRVVHGTTLVINAIIERKGCVAGLLVTRGFGDLLEMRRGRRFDMDDLLIEVPRPLVPRGLVGEVAERMRSAGITESPLDMADAEQAVRRLLDAGVESIGICFLHSYSNPAHEREMKALLGRLAPAIPVSVSSEIAPDIREYERASTTAANAYALPVFRKYIGQFQDGLKRAGYKRSFLMMTSDGGLFEGAHAQTVPVRFLESGPAGGICAARHMASNLKKKNLIAFDMGGTTAKIALIADGKLILGNELEVARQYRFKKGSGLPIHIPSVEMMEIGAGGGSIARVSELGLLQVGPESAGACPGPACYGRGGTEFTVTDANLILGYFGAQPFLGGGIKLNSAAAARAADHLAAALKLDVSRVAWGVHELVSQEMATAARLHLLELGVDPRSATMLAYGGAGPLHACRVARKLGVREIAIPKAAGVFSAFGFLTAPPAVTLVKGLPCRLSTLEPAKAVATVSGLEEQAVVIAREAGASARLDCQAFSLLRYVGQSNEIRVNIARNLEGGIERLERDFHAEYKRLFGRSNSGLGIEVMSLGVTVSDAGPLMECNVSITGAPGIDREVVSAYFEEIGDFTETAVIGRGTIERDGVVEGPLLIQERETTTVLPPRSSARCDDWGNLIVELH